MPPSTRMILESCPPISKIVRTSGCRCVVPTACAVISFFTTFAPIIAPTRRRALPVVPAARTLTFSGSICPARSATTRRAAPAGSPSVHRYVRAMMAPSSSIKTPFVEMDPMSIPRYAFALMRAPFLSSSRACRRTPRGACPVRRRSSASQSSDTVWGCGSRC